MLVFPWFACIEPAPPVEVVPLEEPELEIVGQEPWQLGEGTSSHDAAVKYTDIGRIAAWIRDDQIVVADLPSSDPQAAVPIVLGSVSSGAGRPDIGTAEERLFVAWDDGSGGAYIGGILSSGDIQAILPLADAGTEPQTIALEMSPDGAGIAWLSIDGTYGGSAFDRLLTAATEQPAALLLPDPVIAQALDPSGGRAIVWSGPSIAEDPFIGLRAARFVGDQVEETILETEESIRTGAFAITIRDDGALAVAWIGRGVDEERPVSLWLRVVDADNVPAEPVRIASGIDLDYPALAWAGDHIVAAWSGSVGEDAPSLSIGVASESGEIEIKSFDASESPFNTHRAPALATSVVNDGHKITLLWEIGDEPSLWGRDLLLLER